MTLTQLKYIIALAREQHFGRAADFCCVSQPTLSIGIKKLEQELNVVIFDRQASSFTTTLKGQAIIERAVDIISQAEDLKSYASTQQNPLQGIFKLGAIFTISPYLMPTLVPLMRQKAPKMPLALYENYTENLREKLRQGELDAIVISLPFTETGCEVIDLYDEDFVALVPNEHELASKETLKVSDIQPQQLLLLGQGHCFRDQILNYYQGLSIKELQDSLNLIQGNSIETLKQMVVTGLGITILPQSAANLQSGMTQYVTIKKFSSPAPKRTVSIAFRKQFSRQQAIQLISQTLKDNL